jgi:transcriptional regulator with XRE-family HTH domain
MLYPDAATRVRQRIARLLDERGHTQRSFAKALGHGDQWASNLLTGRQQLAWEDVDKVARFLKVPPGELVRVSDEPWELSPTEMRVVRALRLLPVLVRDHLVTLADYLIGATPEEVELLKKIRSLDEEETAQLSHWIEVQILSSDVVRRTTTPEGHPLTTPKRVTQSPHARRKRNG